MAILLGASDADQPVMGPAVADVLAGLGITRVALLQAPDVIGVVLEGWAFDPTTTSEAVEAIFPGNAGHVRVLGEIEQVAVSTAARNGGSR